MRTRPVLFVLLLGLAMLAPATPAWAQDAGVAEPAAAPAANPADPKPADAKPAEGQGADAKSASPAPADPNAAPAEPPPAQPAVEAPAPAPMSMPGMPAMPGRPQGTPFQLAVRVQKADEAWKRNPVPQQDVLLEIYAGGTMIRTYTAQTGADGVANFDKLTLIPGARFIPVVVADGIRFEGRPIAPTSGSKAEANVNVYEKTYGDEGVVVSDLLTTVDVVEGFLVYNQIWTIANARPRAFDVTHATDPKYSEGLVIQLPTMAEGIEAVVSRGQGAMRDAKVVESRVIVTDPILPATDQDEPLRVQIRYSSKLLDPSLHYSQTIAYPVENMRVITTLTTPYKRTPRLNLSMTAPGFANVGPGRMPGMRDGTEFLIAEGRKAAAGSNLEFTITGFPVHDPVWRWLALVGGLLSVVVGVILFRQDAASKRDPATLAALKRRALEEEREQLYELLRDLDDRFFNGEVTERAYDIEVASLRERLALVLRRLDDTASRKAA